MWVTGRMQGDWYKWLLNKIQVVTRWTSCSRRSKQRRQAICKQTDWLRRGSEGQRRQTADQRWNFPWGHECMQVYVSRFAHTKGPGGRKEWMAVMWSQWYKMMRNRQKYLLYLWLFPPSFLFVLTRTQKSAFQYIYISISKISDQQYMYKSLQIPI